MDPLTDTLVQIGHCLTGTHTHTHTHTHTGGQVLGCHAGLYTIPLFQYRLDPALRTCPTPAPQSPKSQHVPCPARCTNGPSPHPTLSAKMLPEAGDRRVETAEADGSGSNPVFQKGNFMPPTSARGRAAQSGLEEPASTGAGQPERISWGPVGRLLLRQSRVIQLLHGLV
jgi:hypothetical protein